MSGADRKGKKMQEKETIEVDLMDLLCVLCGKGKRILAAGMVCAVLGGMLGVAQYIRGPEVSAEEAQTKEKKEDTALTEEQLKGVIECLDRQYEALDLMQEKQRKYLERSLLMQIEPEEVHYRVKKYLVKGPAEQEENREGASSPLFSVQTVLAAYQTCLTGDRVYQAVADSIGEETDSPYISEVVAVENYQLGDNALNLDMGMGSGSIGGSAPGILTVTIKGKNTVQAEKMCEAMDRAVKETEKQLVEKGMAHTTELLTERQFTDFDLGLAQTKLDIQNRIVDEENKKAETAEKKKGYGAQLAALREEMSPTQDRAEEAVTETAGAWNLKWILAGFFTGAVLGVCWQGAAYVLDGKLHTDSALKDITGVTVYRLRESGKEKKRLEMVLHRIKDRTIHKYTPEELAGQMAGILKARSAEKESVYGVTGSLSGEEKDAFYEALRVRAEVYGIKILSLRNVAYHYEDAAQAAQTKGVILVEGLGISRVQEIRDEVNCLKEYGIPIVGCGLWT